MSSYADASIRFECGACLTSACEDRVSTVLAGKKLSEKDISLDVYSGLEAQLSHPVCSGAATCEVWGEKSHNGDKLSQHPSLAHIGESIRDAL
jgi:hypothetical protein